VSRQSVAKWENEEALPDVEKCVTMAQIFETTVENVFILEPSDFSAKD